MRTPHVALIIPAHLTHPIRAEKIDTTLVSRQILVEGNVGAFTSQDWHVYLNDEACYPPACERQG